jgi:hypothetical protein
MAGRPVLEPERVCEGASAGKGGWILYGPVALAPKAKHHLHSSQRPQHKHNRSMAATATTNYH